MSRDTAAGILVLSRGRGIDRAPEEVAVALLRERDKQRPLLPLNPPGHHSRIALRTDCLGRARARARGGGIAIDGIAARILHLGLQSAEDRRRREIERVRPAQIEARRGTRAEADLLQHVALRHEVAAVDAEEAQDIAIFLVRRVHIPHADRAPAPIGEANKGVPITECGDKTRAVRLHNTLVEGDGLLQLPNRFHPATDILAATEADIAIADLHLPSGDDRIAAECSGERREPGRTRSSRPVTMRVRLFRIELAVELPVRSRRALDLRVGAGRRQRRPDSQDHCFSVQTHCLLLRLVIFQSAHGHSLSGFALLPSMFLHAERQSSLRNICVATYPATAVLSTECKLSGAGR